MIFAGGPIRQREWAVRDHVLALDAAATRANKPLTYCYIVGDSTDNTYDALKEAIRSTGRPHVLSRRPDPPDAGYSRNGDKRYSLHNLARARQVWANLALLDDQTTHLWSVDSDVVVEPDVLSTLLAVATSMCAPMVHLSDNPHVYNFMESWGHDGQPYRSGKEYLHEQSTHPVPATWVGACVLYQRGVFDISGAKFSNSIIESTCPLRMEELGIVRAIRAEGGHPWWVPYAHTMHMMQEPTP